MDMNTFFERQHSARAERSDTLQDARDRWTADRAQEIVEALAGMTTSGRAVYPPTLMVKPRDCKTVGGFTYVSVFQEFGFWLAENLDLLTGPLVRDLLTCPIRTDIKLLKAFAEQHADFECGCKSDEFFDDGGPDWEAA
jgi:hypothetical protein